LLENAMAEIREVHEREVPVPVTVRRSNPVSLFLMFLLGILCTVAAAIIVLLVLDFHGTLTWPAGSVQIGLNSTAPATPAADTTALNTSPVNPPTVNTPPVNTPPADTASADNP
jgi:hypothetical protein